MAGIAAHGQVIETKEDVVAMRPDQTESALEFLRSGSRQCLTEPLGHWSLPGRSVAAGLVVCAINA